LRFVHSYVSLPEGNLGDPTKETPKKVKKKITHVYDGSVSLHSQVRAVSLWGFSTQFYTKNLDMMWYLGVPCHWNPAGEFAIHPAFTWLNL